MNMSVVLKREQIRFFIIQSTFLNFNLKGKDTDGHTQQPWRHYFCVLCVIFPAIYVQKFMGALLSLFSPGGDFCSCTQWRANANIVVFTGGIQVMSHRQKLHQAVFGCRLLCSPELSVFYTLILSHFPICWRKCCQHWRYPENISWQPWVEIIWVLRPQ